MKQILIVDVEMIGDKHLCETCPLFHKDGLHCSYDYITNKSGCHLKPLPQKKPTIYSRASAKSLKKITDSLINTGYNLCIDDILGEQE